MRLLEKVYIQLVAQLHMGKEAQELRDQKDCFEWQVLATTAYAIITTKPLVQVLCMVDGERNFAVGFLYNVMDEAKEQIAKNLGGDVFDYKEI